MRLAIVAAVVIAAVACQQRRHILGTQGAAAGSGSDAGVVAVTDAGAPDATPPDAPPDGPPPSITFAPEPWKVGQTIKVWRRARLSNVPGSQDLTDEYALTFTVEPSTGDGGTHVRVADDCTAVLARGTAKVSGDCSGHASDIAYRLDLVAQMLSVPHDTVTAGDAAGGFTRPLIALFRMQDAGALVSGRVTGADAGGATYAIHVEVDGTMVRPGLRVLGKLDGAIHVDPHVTAMTGTISAPKVTIVGYPVAEYTSKGQLELSFGIEPQ